MEQLSDSNQEVGGGRTTRSKEDGGVLGELIYEGYFHLETGRKCPKCGIIVRTPNVECPMCDIPFEECMKLEIPKEEI